MTEAVLTLVYDPALVSLQFLVEQLTELEGVTVVDVVE